MTTPGINGLPKVQLHTADGASGEIYLHGAHLTSWKAAGGQERLFMSPRSEFASGAAIRGGVPVIFPQFSGLGPLPKHGFARNHAWELASISNGEATLRFEGSEETNKIWPHRFRTELTFRVASDTLEMTLKVENTGDNSFDFHAALHGYFAVESSTDCSVTGLGGLSWRNNPTASIHEGSEKVIRFGEEVDRTFYASTERVIDLVGGGSRYQFTQDGFNDSVVWNPGPKVCASIPDLEPDSWLHYICVEAASVQKPVHLQPGGVWKGTQRVKA